MRNYCAGKVRVKKRTFTQPLTPEDIRRILHILRQFAFLQERANSDKSMKQRYLKLLGLVSSSEAQEELFKRSDDTAKSPKRPLPRTRKKPPAKTQAPKVCRHNHDQLSKARRVQVVRRVSSTSLNPPVLSVSSARPL